MIAFISQHQRTKTTDGNRILCWYIKLFFPLRVMKRNTVWHSSSRFKVHQMKQFNSLNRGLHFPKTLYKKNINLATNPQHILYLIRCTAGTSVRVSSILTGSFCVVWKRLLINVWSIFELCPTQKDTLCHFLIILFFFLSPLLQLLSSLCQTESISVLSPFNSRSLCIRSRSSYPSHLCLSGRLSCWFTANLFIRPSLSSLAK